MSKRCCRTGCLTVSPGFSRFVNCGYHNYTPSRLLSSTRRTVISRSFTGGTFNGTGPVNHAVRYNGLRLGIIKVVRSFSHRSLLGPCSVFISVGLVRTRTRTVSRFNSYAAITQLTGSTSPRGIERALLNGCVGC